MFAKGLGLLVSLVGVFWLAIAGAVGAWKYERLPVGWPNYQLKCCLVVHLTLHAPGAGSVTALAAQRDAALANLKTCHTNVAVLQGALATQNAAVLATRAAGDRMSLAAQQAVQRASEAGRRERDLAAKVMAERAPDGADQLALCRAAEAALREVAK